MSDVDFDNLTDAELHSKLISYGFPNVPVTETSRGILLKKLKNHLKNTSTIVGKNANTNKKWERTSAHQQQKQQQQPFSSKFEQMNSTVRIITRPQCTVPDMVKMKISELEAQEKAAATCSHAGQSSDTMPLLDALTRPEVIQRSALRARMYASPMILSTETEDESDYDGFMRLDQQNNNTPVGLYIVTNLRRINYTRGGLHDFVTPYAIRWALSLSLFVFAFLFMFQRLDPAATIAENNTNYVVCRKYDPMLTFGRPPYTCIESERLTGALELIRHLHQVLKQRAVQHYCVDREYPSAISAAELTRYLQRQGLTVDMRNVEAAEYLITCNSQWMINILDADGSPVIFNGVQKQLSNDHIYFTLSKPNLPFKCVAYNKLQKCFEIIGTGTLLSLITIFAFAFFRHISNTCKKRRVAVEIFVTDIINALNESSESKEVIVSHLRDRLIPMSGREQNLWAWEEALRLLEANESRIQFGTTLCEGVECRTMKWVADNTSTC